MLTRLFKRKTNTKIGVVGEYKKAALAFGETISYIHHFGPPTNFLELFNRWKDAEKNYVKFGFKPLSLDCLESSFWGKDIESKWCQKLLEKEKPIYHAEIYQRYWLNYNGETHTLREVNGTFVSGSYICPSTEAFVDLWLKENNE